MTAGMLPPSTPPDVPAYLPPGDAALADLYIAVRRRPYRHADPGLPDLKVASVAEVLRSLGIVGGVLDGAALDARGWVIATTVGFDDGRVLRWAPGTDGRPSTLQEDLTWSAVRDFLSTWFGSDVQVGRYVVVDSGRLPSTTGLSALPAVETARQEPVVQVAVGWWSASQLVRGTRAVAAALHVARVDGATVLAPAAPDVPVPLITATARGRGPALLLWSTGAQHGFVASGPRWTMRHAWRPRWQLVDPSETTRGGGSDHAAATILSQFAPPDARAAERAARELARSFRVHDPARIATLTTLLADDMPVVPVPRLLAALGLPAVIGDILAGRSTVAQLPGARLERPAGLIGTAWRSLTTSRSRPTAPSTLPPARWWPRAGERPG